MPAPSPTIYKPALHIIRVAGLCALAGITVGSLGHDTRGFRITAAAFGTMFLVLAVLFAWMLVWSWRTRGGERGLMLMAFGIVGWVLLGVASATVAAHEWGPARWDPVGMLVTAAVACLALCFGPVVMRGRRAVTGLE